MRSLYLVFILSISIDFWTSGEVSFKLTAVPWPCNLLILLLHSPSSLGERFAKPRNTALVPNCSRQWVGTGEGLQEFGLYTTYLKLVVSWKLVHLLHPSFTYMLNYPHILKEHIYKSPFSLAWNEYGRERPQYQHWEIEWHFPAWWVARKMTALWKSDLYSYLNFCEFPIIISWRYMDLIIMNKWNILW